MYLQEQYYPQLCRLQNAALITDSKPNLKNIDALEVAQKDIARLIKRWKVGNLPQLGNPINGLALHYTFIIYVYEQNVRTTEDLKTLRSLAPVRHFYHTSIVNLTALNKLDIFRVMTLEALAAHMIGAVRLPNLDESHVQKGIEEGYKAGC